MIDTFLILEKTTITAKGDSEPLDVNGAANRVFLATLSITKIVEQESFELTFFTSADGTTWEAKPVASLPQKFYPGEYPLLVDLSHSENARFLRAHWEVSRWDAARSPPASKRACGCARFRRRCCKKLGPKPLYAGDMLRVLGGQTLTGITSCFAANLIAAISRSDSSDNSRYLMQWG